MRDASGKASLRLLLLVLVLLLLLYPVSSGLEAFCPAAAEGGFYSRSLEAWPCPAHYVTLGRRAQLFPARSSSFLLLTREERQG